MLKEKLRTRKGKYERGGRIMGVIKTILSNGNLESDAKDWVRGQEIYGEFEH